MCTSLFLLLSLPLSSLSPLGSNSSHCATPTPTPCDHLPPPTKAPFPYPGHPPFPAFVAAPLLLPHLSRPVHPPRGTGTPIPHTRLQEGRFAPPSSGAPCQAACTAHPHPTADAYFAQPHRVAFRWTERRTDSQWTLGHPKAQAKVTDGSTRALCFMLQKLTG